MERVASFEKVSLEQYQKDSGFKEEVYNKILLPFRATEGSAGYDFSIPFPCHLEPGETIRIPTGIRCKITSGWVLMIFPRSSLGFKYKLQLDNTAGIIDSDYYYAENEGHIMIKVTNHGEKPLDLKENDRFAQGIFLPFGITVDDEAIEKRTGGFGSTNERK